MAQQTAVEWLIEQLVELDKLFDGRRKSDNSTVMKLNPVKIFKQAKQMEKEQTVNAWERGKYIGMTFSQGFIPNEYEQNGTQYYNQTYIEQ
jgi:hypothetical protein